MADTGIAAAPGGRAAAGGEPSHGIPSRLRASALEGRTDVPGAARLLLAAADAPRARVACIGVWRRRPLRVVLESDGGDAELVLEELKPPFGLSIRELEVATGVAVGLSNPEIAEVLCCSRRTVATHVEHILAKLGVASRLAVARRVDRYGLHVIWLDGSGPLDGLATDAVLDDAAHDDVPPVLVVAKRPVRLTAFYPQSDEQSRDALAMRRGAELAVSAQNERGGLDGRRLELVVREVTGSTLSRAVGESIADGTDAIMIGSFPTEWAVAAMEASAPWGGPMLHSMVAPQLSEAVLNSGGRLGHVFQVASTEDVYVRGFFRTLRAVELAGSWAPRTRRATVAVRPHLTRADALEPMHEMARRAGWSLVDVLPLGEATDLDAFVHQVATQRPRALHLPIMSEGRLATLLRLLRDHECRPLIYANWSPTAPDFVSRFGSETEGLIWSTIVGTYADPLSRSFRSRYRDRYREDPGTGASAIHFDIVRLLSATWSEVRAPWDFRSVIGALRPVLFRGVAGPIHFGGPGQRALSFPDDAADPTLGHAHLVFQVQHGRSRLIAPEGLATGSFIPPSS